MNISSSLASLISVPSDNIIYAVILFVIGLVLIVKGGDVFVDAATWIAEATGIPKFIIGATVVSFATTLPELLVSSIAAAKGQNDMAIGNAVGSVTANIGLIMSISVLCMPAVIKRSSVALKGSLMILAVAALFAFSYDLDLNLWQSIIMIAIFAVFMIENIISGKKSLSADSGEVEKTEHTGKQMALNIVKFLIGAAAVVVGADLPARHSDSHNTYVDFQKAQPLAGRFDGLYLYRLCGGACHEFVHALSSVLNDRGCIFYSSFFSGFSKVVFIFMFNICIEIEPEI